MEVKKLEVKFYDCGNVEGGMGSGCEGRYECVHLHTLFPVSGV